MSACDPLADVTANTHTDGMRWLALVIPIIVSACSRVENTFVVADEQKIVAAAELTLCGAEVPLQRSGGRLTVSKVIDCEGSGRIRLRYASGGEYDCIVGYVTPGAVQNFTFRATKSGCA